MKHKVSLHCGLIALALILAPSAKAQDAYVFGFPPLGSTEKQKETYQPIVTLLSRVSDKPIVMRFTDDWLSYQRDVKNDAHDLVFDAPAFIGWRITKFNHTPIARLHGQLKLAIIVKNDDNRLRDVKDLAGYSVCSFPPPNMAALILYNRFDNPSRQPVIADVQSFKEAYAGLLAGRCRAAIIPNVMLGKLDTQHRTRILYDSAPLPNPGFAASPRIPAAVQQKMVEALLSSEGAAATAHLRAEFGDARLTTASSRDYEGLGTLLRVIWGMEL